MFKSHGTWCLWQDESAPELRMAALAHRISGDKVACAGRQTLLSNRVWTCEVRSGEGSATYQSRTEITWSKAPTNATRVSIEIGNAQSHIVNS